MTEFVNPPAPQRKSKSITVADPLAAARPVQLDDEEIGLGSMHIVRGKAFSLGTDSQPIPVTKKWEVIEGRQFLVESTPLNWIAPKLAALPRFAGEPLKREPQSLKQLLAASGREAQTASTLASIEHSALKHDDQPGVVLDYLIVNQSLLNVDFASYNKSGPAAIGQESWDYWNAYDFPESSSAALTDLQWSDYSGGSGVGIVMSNAPGVGSYSLIEDGMYGAFVYGATSARLTVTITNLPANVYDLLVYAPRTPANGSPVVELKRSGTTLWTKNLSRWGNGWRSPVWEDGEQYVRFRDIAVTNQTLRLEVIPDAAGYTTLSGLQIAPAGAIASEQPSINKLLNVDVSIAHSNKVGLAAVGIGATDVWNNYSFPSVNAASLTNLKWSDNSSSSAGLVLRNGAGQWGVMLPDVMLRNYNYAQNQGNITVTLTNLPSGSYDILAYGHTTTLDDNGVFEVWSDEVNWGIKGTSLQGYGPYSNRWELGQQYVRIAGVALANGRPVYLQSKKTTYGYNNLSGLQFVRTGDLDTDADGLPDAWEMKWFGTLDYDAATDYDYDGLTNLREYQLGLFPTRADTDGDGIVDWQDNEFPLVDDSTPQGALLYSSGETWNWVTSWSGGGWGGGTVFPHSGSKFHLSANVPNALHQHYFERALEVTRARTGDVFYAYVNLDPTYPPAEVMLQFYVLESNGSYSFEHRAYWGANNITSGVNGTVSRTNLGVLPTAGQWVRLEVPAKAVGLEGRIVEGIAFTLYGGRAAWDSAGIVVPDMDGDGVADIDADGLPDLWELKHFGNLSQPPSGENGDYDGDGNSNWQEYQNGTDPNTIRFSIVTTNKYVSTSITAVQLSASGGSPQQMSVLMDNTNTSTATWGSFNNTVSLNFGTTEGWHVVRVGLRGLSPDSEQTWERKRLKLDLTPPVLILTNPVTEITTQPMVQLNGFSDEELSSISCSISNSGGTFTNQLIYLVGQVYDTNASEFTTNFFQGFDLDLLPGTNVITVRAADLAGNVTITNLALTLTNDANAPVVSLYWPQNGSSVIGDVFTWRGKVDDFTAMVTALIVDENDNTNIVTAVVERDGNYWAEGLPLSNGTNFLTLRAEDPWGNSSVTNIVIEKSAITLTIDEIPTEQLHDSVVTVTGSIGSSDYTVWVNGVKSTNNGDGTWIAGGVQLPDGGTALLQARAIPNTDNGGNGSGGGGSPSYLNPRNPSSAQANDRERENDKPEGVYVFSDTYKINTLFEKHWLDISQEFYDLVEPASSTRNWTEKDAGRDVQKITINVDSFDYVNGPYSSSCEGTIVIKFPTKDWPPYLADFALQTATRSGIGPCMENGMEGERYVPIPSICPQYCDVELEEDYTFDWPTAVETEHLEFKKTAETKMHLRAGGKGIPKRAHLWAITGSIGKIVNRWEGFPCGQHVPKEEVPYYDMKICEEVPNSNSRVWKIVPHGADIDVTPSTHTCDYYIFNVSATKYKSYFTVYAKMPDPTGCDNVVGDDAGHAWWRLTTDAPDEGVHEFLSESFLLADETSNAKYLGSPAGYYPSLDWTVILTWPVGSFPGLLEIPESSDGNESSGCSKRFEIGFDDLIGGVWFTKNLHNNPGTWNALFHNCVHAACDAGKAVGVNLGSPVFPQKLGNYIRVLNGEQSSCP